jgi:(S)-sulfolactate dehydrogenase
MARIVITEFMDAAAVRGLEQDHDVVFDAGLWNRRLDLEAAVASAHALIVRNRTQVDAALIELAPQLKVIGRLGVGLDNIDTRHAAARNIVVAPAVGANAVSVAEYVITSALVLLRGAYFSSAELVAGKWPRESLGAGREAFGAVLGIVGYGSIGQLVGEKARAMGLKVQATDDFLPADHPAWAGVSRVSLDEVLRTSDVVTLHCPLTPATRRLIGAERIALMRRGSVLINTARGGIVDEAALAAALHSGQLAGAAIDVFEHEPIDAATGSLFSGLANIILTPHIAGVTAEANTRISAITAENVRRVLAV